MATTIFYGKGLQEIAAPMDRHMNANIYNYNVC